MRYDVVIIGSGLGGLECGYILARNGRRVLVLEQGRQMGGCLQSYRRGRQTFDTGFHYVGGLDEGQSLHAAFRYLGLLDLPWRRMDKEGFDLVTIAGRTFSFAQGYDSFVEGLAGDFPAEREALQRYADLLRRSSELQWSALDPDGEGSDLPQQWMEQSAWDYLQQNFRSSLLRSVLCGTSLKMELRRESLPLFTFLHGNGSYVESSWRLRGDASQIVSRLADGIRAHGGDIRCRCKVVELTEKEGRIAAALCADGNRYEADLFISDLHPAPTCQLVRESSCIKPAYRNRINSLENTYGMFTLSLHIKPRALHYFNHNRYVYPKPHVWNLCKNNSTVGGVLISCRVPEDDTDFTTQVDILTPMGWERCRQWNMTVAGKRDGKYKEMKERMADECIGLAEQFIPNLRQISRGFTSTPLTWRDYTLTPDGSAYGVRKDFRSPLTTMLSPRTPVPNLLLTGQSLMLHGVHGVTMTAFHTCAEVLGKEAVWAMIKE